MNAELLESHARLEARMPAEWRAFRFECFPKTKDTLYFEIEGAVCPLVQRGKRAGRPNWHKLDKQTRKTITITTTEQEAFEAKWEMETGKCRECTGTGRELKSIGIHGAEYNQCGRCSGSGIAP